MMWEVFEAPVPVTDLHTKSYSNNNGYDNVGVASGGRDIPSLRVILPYVI